MQRDENRRIYERRGVGARYASRSQLQPVEAEILRRYRSSVAGGRTLDLGVGAARTTPFLLDLSAQYVGVDYSAEMVARCRERFPSANFQLGDARNLAAFPDASFDFVLFSYNGLDEVGHADRLQVLQEISRVLKPGGLFVFSSHNRDFPIPKPWNLGHLAVNPARHPLRFGKQLISYPIGIVNYLRRRHRAEERDEYCVSVDVSYSYSLLHYHIRADAQARQLQLAGFGDVEAFGLNGDPFPVGGSSPVADPWIHYACRRTAAPDASRD